MNRLLQNLSNSSRFGSRLASVFKSSSQGNRSLSIKSVLRPATVLALLFTPVLALALQSSNTSHNNISDINPASLTGSETETSLPKAETNISVDTSGSKPTAGSNGSNSSASVEINDQQIAVPDNGTVEKTIKKDGETVRVRIESHNSSNSTSTSLSTRIYSNTSISSSDDDSFITEVGDIFD